MPINSERLADIFIKLCEIDSPSFHEARIAAFLKDTFSHLGGAVIEDSSATVTGSDCGNLIVRFEGKDHDRDPVLFSCHMDTVKPGTGVKVKREGNRFSSVGDTILGGDDKSGIAVLIEAITVIQEDSLPVGTLEFVFTTCEETGLLGAKALAAKQLSAKIGYALDMDTTDQVITHAPAANRIAVEITGVAAHAGMNPEQGVNAIQLAAQALSTLRLGRLDEESTANFGKIKGGVATNIIPAHVILDGEVRSHSEEKLIRYTKEMIGAFSNVVDDWADPDGKATGKPGLNLKVEQEYPVLKLTPDNPVIKRVQQAASTLGRTMEPVMTGGGSDANIFNGYGIATAIIGTGMKKVHTVDEYIDLEDMIRTTELVVSIITSPLED
ncbi:M20/M25/M40 family metallo-hydrolase [Thermodesulfobacteriota bacterium]